MGWIKDVLRTAGIWIVILAVALLVLEGIFRLVRNEPDPLAQIAQEERAHLFKPESVLHSLSSVPGEYDYVAHIDRQGYRGREISVVKPKGVRRIFAIGDSFTFGVGSPDESTIPALLEEALRRDDPDGVEVVNAGVGGAGTIAHYLNLRRVHLQYQPDLVVLFFDLTDLWDDWNVERHAIYGPDGEIVRFDPMFVNGRRDAWITLTYHSVFARYFHNKVVRTIRKMQVLGVGGYLRSAAQGKRAKAVISSSPHEVKERASVEYDGLLLMRGHSREKVIRGEWVRTSEYLLKIRDLLAARGIPLVIVMYPHGIYVDGDQWHEGRKTWGFEQGRRYDDLMPFEMMAGFCRDNGIPFVNTLDAFLKAPKDKYFFDWDGHMTSKGNAIVARTLAGDPVFRSVLKSVGK